MTDPTTADVVQGTIALGVIGLLVKELVSALRSHNGHGQVTRTELQAHVDAIRSEVADVKREVLRVRDNQHELRNRLGQLLGRQDLNELRLDRLEEGKL